MGIARHEKPMIEVLPSHDTNGRIESEKKRFLVRVAIGSPEYKLLHNSYIYGHICTIDGTDMTVLSIKDGSRIERRISRFTGDQGHEEVKSDIITIEA